MNALKDFFSYRQGNMILEPFNRYHFYAIFALCLLILAIIIFRKQLREPKIGRLVCIIASVIAISFEIIYHILDYNYLPYRDFMISLIPLELCAISLWISAYINVSGNTKPFFLLYYTSIGAIASVFVPEESGLGPDRFRYYDYFGVHTFIVLTVVFLIVVKKMRINTKSFLKTFAIMLPWTGIEWIIDKIFNVNYMYVMSPPDTANPFDMFVNQPYPYFLGVLGFGLATFIVFTIPWWIAGFIKKVTNKNINGAA